VLYRTRGLSCQKSAIKGASRFFSRLHFSLATLFPFKILHIIEEIMPLVLASQSPRRAELLRQIGVTFTTVVPNVDESRRAGERAAHYVRRLADAKAQAGLHLINSRNAVVLAADTIVVFQDTIFGKPENSEQGKHMLRQLSGQCHQVMTAVTMVNGVDSKSELAVTNVVFRDLSAALIDRYWQFDEPLDKAGAYAIQGLGAVFVRRIEGSYSNVVGLPIETLIPLFDFFTISYWCR
jgi:septum formation protein